MKKSTRSISRPRKAGLSNRNIKKPVTDPNKKKKFPWVTAGVVAGASAALLWQAYEFYQLFGFYLNMTLPEWYEQVYNNEMYNTVGHWADVDAWSRT